jgi:hypothetical protein
MAAPMIATLFDVTYGVLRKNLDGWEPAADAGKPWEEVVQALEMSQERIRAGFATATPDRLGAPSPETGFPFPCETVADLLAALHFHESYHVGQTGTLRRLAGLEGAIK